MSFKVQECGFTVCVRGGEHRKSSRENIFTPRQLLDDWAGGQEVGKGVGGGVKRVPSIEVNLCFHPGPKLVPMRLSFVTEMK